jgi:DNA-directed RNA polymerase II subunit RPB2
MNRSAEMENSALQANAAAFFLRDRLLENSDLYKCWVCEACGQIAVAHKGLKTTKCPICVNSQCYMVQMPYSTKLLIQYLKAQCIVPRIII